MSGVDKDVFIQLLTEAVVSVARRKELMSRFEELAGEAEIVNASSAEAEAIEDFGYDLAYYTTNPDALRQDATLFGDDELLRRIRSVLTRIANSE